MSLEKLTNAETTSNGIVVGQRTLDGSSDLRTAVPWFQKMLSTVPCRGCCKAWRKKGSSTGIAAWAIQLFSANMGREAYGGLMLESLANNLTGGSIAPLLTHLLEEKKLGKAEIKRFKKTA